MATLSEISAANNYGGQSQLAGSVPNAVQLDARPLESLAHYVFFYNKNLYDQKQKDADARAAELAELSKFNPDAALEQDKAAAMDAWNRLVTFGNDYARKPLTGQAKDTLKQQWDFQNKIHSTLSLINKVQKRAISYNTQKDAINKRTDITEGQKSVLLKKLDSYASTDSTVDIPTLPEFDLKVPEIKPAVLDSLEVSTNLGNQIVTTKLDVFNPRRVLGQASTYTTGLGKLFTSPDSEQYKTAGEGEKTKFDLFAQSNNDFKFWKDAEDFLAQAVNDTKYKKDGKIDFNAIAAANPMLSSIYKTVDAYNAWASDKRQQASKGVFVDHLGRSLKVLNPVSPDDYFTLDKEKPLSAEQIVMLQQWAASPKLVVKGEDIKQTNEALTKRGQDLDYDAAMARIKASEKDDLQMSDYQPFQSILSSVGGVNKQVPLSKLSTSQIGAISPSLLNEKGQLSKAAQDLKVSIGKNNNGEFGVYLFDAAGKRAAQIPREQIMKDGLPVEDTSKPDYFSGELITPSTLLSNASSWLATFGKEMKSQDAYRFQPNAFTNAFNNDLLNKNKSATQSEVDESDIEILSGKIDVNKLHMDYRYKVNGKIYVWDGSKLKPYKQ